MSVLRDIFEYAKDQERDSPRENSLFHVLQRIFHLDSSEGRSTSEAAMKGTIASRLLVEDKLEDIEIAGALGLLLCQLQTAFTLVAINVHQSINRFDIVSDAMGRVSMEGAQCVAPVKDTKAMIDAILNLDEHTFNQIATLEATTVSKSKAGIRELEKFAVSQSYELEFQVDTEKGNTIKPSVVLTILMLPGILPYTAVKHIIKNGNQEKLFRRLVKVIIGEINPFLDFILCRDLVREQGDAIKQDKHNVLTDYHDDLLKKKRKYTMDLITGRVRNNLANSIMVVDEESMKAACHEASIDLTNKADRKRFMAENYMNMFATVDQAHGIVTIYVAAMDDVIEIGFERLKSLAAKNNGISPEQLTKVLAQGHAPRF